ncbi:hypothetical protein ASD24_24955 [Paenibacillus sp. Root52]|uniref:hypothetical protein n=1 Tax=Paenibacillus sp. Root52 TaxID=1736552 RepID=UPI000701C719|nr:hypothetical protein [Paenibacillus sp. Root52]KQY90157.1 hypothetical protein ASD24_24955 [Paenibacillus sp. Root52]
MSQTNIVMYMEEELSIDKLESILLKFNAKNQISSWAMEQFNSWIWVNYYILKHHDEIRNIWCDISKDMVKDVEQTINVKTALFIQPSRDRNAVFFALSFCKEIYTILDTNKNVFLYHGDSGFFANEEIANLQFMNTQQFYDSRFANNAVAESIIECLNDEVTGGIECVEEEGGWDGEELQYIDLFRNLFKMREQLRVVVKSINNTVSFNAKIIDVDELILRLLDVDDDKLLISAGDQNRDYPINSWWWHLDQVEAGILKVHVKEGVVIYQGQIILI